MSRRVPSGPKPVAAGSTSRGGELEGVIVTDSNGTERSIADSVGGVRVGDGEAIQQIASVVDSRAGTGRRSMFGGNQGDSSARAEMEERSVQTTQTTDSNSHLKPAVHPSPT